MRIAFRSVILTLNWGRRITSDDNALFKEISEVEAGIVGTRSTLENLQDYIRFSGGTRSQRGRNRQETGGEDEISTFPDWTENCETGSRLERTSRVCKRTPCSTLLRSFHSKTFISSRLQ